MYGRIKEHEIFGMVWHVTGKSLTAAFSTRFDKAGEATSRLLVCLDEPLPDCCNHLAEPENVQCLQCYMPTHVKNNQPGWQRHVVPKPHQLVTSLSFRAI